MARVLLLNASYEVLNTVSLKRAIVLCLEGRAEVVEEDPRPILTTAGTIPRPSVVRLRSYIPTGRRSTIPLSRRAILARDSHECQFTHCGRKATTMDHVVPRSKGGEHSWENIVAACRPCNAKKGDRSLAQMGWSLRRTPKPPVPGKFIVTGDHNPSWLRWL